MKWEVTENNGGGVALYVWEDAHKNSYVHIGYEYTPSNLLQDIKALYAEDGSEDTSTWDGNYLIENETTIEEAYDDHSTTKVIAEGNEERYIIHVSRLGHAGAKCLLC